MTTQLEDALNLPHIDDVLKEDAEDGEVEGGGTDVEPHPDVERLSNMLAQTAGLETVMADPMGVMEHVREMDEIYDQAMTAHKDMLDLAFNVEAKNSGQIFSPAAQMLDIALRASRSKSDQRAKAIKLQLEKQKMDTDRDKNTTDGVIQADGGVMATRNAVMSQLKGEKKKP